MPLATPIPLFAALLSALFQVAPAQVAPQVTTHQRTVRAGAGPVRAAYFYNYMPPAHIDSLADHGFDRAVIHWITDSLGVPGATELARFRARGDARGVEVVPQWALQAPTRLRALPTLRRYTWGAGNVEVEVGCPADSTYWRTTLLDRAEEMLASAPGAARLAVDLEIYFGGIHHYDRGACRCAACLAEYLGPAAGSAPNDPRRLTGLIRHQEARIARVLAALLVEFGARHPGVELGVFDLDYDSFVHRAFARALARADVPTASYCERSYTDGGERLAEARARLDALGLETAPIVGGLWLKRFAPADLPAAVRGVLARADGYFVFTTYSLWQQPAKLAGPYLLAAPPSAYWRALAEANHP